VGNLSPAWAGHRDMGAVRGKNGLANSIDRRSYQDYSSTREKLQQRKELCRSLIKSYFAPHPDIVSFLNETLTLAAQMHWRRNLLVHGEIATIATWIAGSELRFGLKASGRHNGKDITLEFYPDDFDQLYGNLAHCYGRFDFLAGREVNNPMLSSQDRQILLDFVLRNLPNLPTPPALAHQPSSLSP
jgi:hypothetical protein